MNALTQAVDSAAATEAFWVRDGPAPFRAGFTDEAATRVRTFLAARGQGLAEVSATLNPDEASGQAHLHLATKERPRTTIGRITVIGAQRNTPEEIIHCTGLAPGAEATPAAIARAKVALWNSSRFYSFDVVPKPAATPGPTIDLLISIAEIKARPLLREPLSPTDAALVKFANWATTQPRVGNWRSRPRILKVHSHSPPPLTPASRSSPKTRRAGNSGLSPRRIVSDF